MCFFFLSVSLLSMNCTVTFSLLVQTLEQNRSSPPTALPAQQGYQKQKLALYQQRSQHELPLGWLSTHPECF